jgi:uncharacterized protein
VTVAPEDKPFELERFELVLLRRPAGRDAITDEEAERLQVLHLEHLGSMAAAGHLVIAGPFDEQQDETLRGLCLYRTGSLEGTRSLAESDPAVQAHRFEIEVMFFWCEKDVIGHRSPADESSGIG